MRRAPPLTKGGRENFGEACKRASTNVMGFDLVHKDTTVGCHRAAPGLAMDE
jgi:hypothetical protein